MDQPKPRRVLEFEVFELDVVEAYEAENVIEGMFEGPRLQRPPPPSSRPLILPVSLCGGRKSRSR